MHRPSARLTLAISATAACMFCAVTVAQAATKFDTSYQNGGTLQLPPIKHLYGQVAQTCDVSGRRLNIAGRFGNSEPGLPRLWATGQQLATTSIKLRPRQSMTLGIAKVNWRMQRIPTGQVVAAQDFDSKGGFAYVTRSQKKSQRGRLKLFRILANGRRDAKFGRKGYISIRVAGLPALWPAGLRVIALPYSKVAVLAQTPTRQVLLRFTRSGKPDKNWGKQGVVKLRAPIAFGGTPLAAVDSATMTPDGGMLISANNLPGKPSSGVLGVLKLDSAGKPDKKWANDGYWTPPAANKPKHGTTPYTITGQSLMTSIRKNGDYAVLYADAISGELGTYSELKLAYVDASSGVTTLFNERAGTYRDGADGDSPDATPWILGESSAGTVFAYGESSYASPGGMSHGAAVRFTADADQQAAQQKLANSGFSTGEFAVDPAARFLYFCGALGVTSSKSKDPERRSQRKTVAIRRIKL